MKQNRKNTVRIGLTELLVVLAFGIGLSVTGLAQRTQTNKDSADQNLKSTARVNPSTLAMEFEIPLAKYSGRNGSNLPVSIFYSSKVWNITMVNSRFEKQAVSGFSDYDWLTYDSSDNMPMFAEKSIAGWTSSLQAPAIVFDSPWYNEYGEIYRNYSQFAFASRSDDPEDGVSCQLQGSTTGHVPTEYCASGMAHITVEKCKNEGSEHEYIRESYVCLEDTSHNPPPNPQAEPTPAPQVPHIVERLRIQMPDGSSHEFRKNDLVCNLLVPSPQCLEPAGNTYLSVDGSRTKFVRGVTLPDSEVRDVLYMPDGSKYLFQSSSLQPGQFAHIADKFVDNNGNVMTYRWQDRVWIDTLGREVQDPLNDPLNFDRPAVGAQPMVLPGLNAGNMSATAHWQKLGDTLDNPNQTPLKFLGEDKCTSALPTPITGGALFHNQPIEPQDNEIVNRQYRHYRHRTCANSWGNPAVFNPTVLAAVTLPGQQKYTFKYNEYGEITKIIYPTGGYERFEYGPVASIGFSALEVYEQANRGVHKRFVSEDGTTETQEWEYESAGNTVRTTAPDGSSSERVLFASAASMWGFEDPRNGMVEEEVVKDQNNAIRSRTINDWGKLDEQGSGAFGEAMRDPRVERSVSIIFEPDSEKALATLEKIEYDNAGSSDFEHFAHLNVKRKKSYHYAVVTAADVDSESLSWTTIESWFPETKLASVSETDYVYDADYKSRGIPSLAIRTKALDPSGPDSKPPLSVAETIFDNSVPSASPDYEYTVESYSGGSTYDCSATQTPKICWQRPNSTGDPDLRYRGLPTTSRVWVKETGTWIQTHSRFDKFGNVVKTKDPVGNETTTEFSAIYKYAYPTKLIAPPADPTGTTGSDAVSTIETNYDFTTGLPTSVIDDLGQVTTTTYDNALRPRFVNPVVVNGNPTGPVTETQYGVADANGQLPVDQRFLKVRKQIDADNWDEATSWFDGLGRTVKTQAKDSQGDVFVETQYDSLGRPYLVTNPYRAGETVWWNKTKYDAAGRAFKSFAPASYADATSQTEANLVSLGTTAFGISTVSSATENFIGTVVTTTDASGRKGRSITNALGQLLRVDEPTAIGGTSEADLGALATPNQPTSYKYDPYGKMVEVKQDQQKRWFKYDSLGRLLRVRQPEQEINQSLDMADPFNADGDWTAGFAYDKIGNVTRATDANGVNIINEYDKAGRAIRRCYTKPNVTLVSSVDTCAEIPDDPPENDLRSTDTPPVEFYYDGKGLASQQSPNFAKGKLTKVTNGISATEYMTFDNFGRLTRSKQITDGVEYGGGSDPNLWMTYTYNLSGALVEERYPSGRVVKNEFEQDGDLLTVASKKTPTGVFHQYASNFSYTASGGVSQMRLGNGKWETARFNTRLQVDELGLGTSAANAGLWKVHYTYGEFDENWNFDAAKNTGNIATQTLTVPGATFVQNYRYDPLYRLKDAVEPGIGSTPNWTQTFDYDRYGNRTAFTQTVGGVTTHNSTPAVSNGVNATNRFTSTDFEYDKNGNLVADVDPLTGQNRTFSFNADNKQREVIVNGASVGQYFYDGEGKRVKKIVGNETTVFVYSAGKLVAEYSTAAPPAEGHINYTTTDHLGSPRIITNELGQVTNRRDFMPFGEDLNAGVGNRTADPGKYSTAGDKVRQKFTGYQKDEETKLDFAEARMYENRFGRFTAVDPFLASGKSANPQTFNRYVYVGNRPTRISDPNGLDWWDVIDNATGKRVINWFDDDPDEDLYTINQRWTNYVYRASDGNWYGLDPNSSDRYRAQDENAAKLWVGSLTNFDGAFDGFVYEVTGVRDMAYLVADMRTGNVDGAMGNFGMIAATYGAGAGITKYLFGRACSIITLGPLDDLGGAAGSELTTALVPKAASSLGKWGETRLAQILGGAAQKNTKPISTTLGNRVPDFLVDGVAHEAKAGLNVGLNSSLRKQVLKDAELIAEKQIKGAHWHFFQGAQKEVLDYLTQNGIKYTVH